MQYSLACSLQQGCIEHYLMYALAWYSLSFHHKLEQLPSNAMMHCVQTGLLYHLLLSHAIHNVVLAGSKLNDFWFRYCHHLKNTMKHYMFSHSLNDKSFELLSTSESPRMYKSSRSKDAMYIQEVSMNITPLVKSFRQYNYVLRY